MNPSVALTVLVACCVAWGCVLYLEGMAGAWLLPRVMLHNKTTTTTTVVSSTHPPSTKSTSQRSSSVNRHPAANASSTYEPPDFGVPSFARSEGTTTNASHLDPRHHHHHLLPLPVQVVEQYIQWHSVEALRRDPTNRRYAIAFYSCPLQAGNRLHHFLAGFYWSIATNRTMLWKYWDTATCQHYDGALYNPHICWEANTVADCDPILARAPWIPSYDEWHVRLNLPPPVQVPFYATHPQYAKDRHIQWGPGNDERIQGIDDDNNLYHNDTVWVLAQTRFEIKFMARPKDSNVLLHTLWSRNTNARLHRHGVDFWHGLLQRYSWQLTPRIVQDAWPTQSYLQYPKANRSQYYSIALHSRHIDPQDDGCNVSREMACVTHLLTQRRRHNAPALPTRRLAAAPEDEPSNSTTTTTTTPVHHHHHPCAVHLLSDRPCTLTQLMDQVTSHTGCETLVASHETHTDFLSEHGPFAGAGFFQDWALALHAHSAFVGLRRSSSDLLQESLTFERGRHAWHQAWLNGATDPSALEAAIDQATLDSCMLSDMKG